MKKNLSIAFAAMAFSVGGYTFAQETEEAVKTVAITETTEEVQPIIDVLAEEEALKAEQARLKAEEKAQKEAEKAAKKKADAAVKAAERQAKAAEKQAKAEAKAAE